MARQSVVSRADLCLDLGDMSGGRGGLSVASAAEGLLSDQTPAPGNASIHYALRIKAEGSSFPG